MKKIFVCCLLWVVSGYVFAQQKAFDKEVELKRFVERGGKYEETAPNIYKLTYHTGETRIFNLNSAQKENNLTEGVDTTIINVWEIDTLLYYQKFSFWQKVQVANSRWVPVFVEDLNKNGRPELYGYTNFNDLPYPSGGPVRIFERDVNGVFKNVSVYDSTTLFVKAIGDIHSSGRKEVYSSSRDINNGRVYKSIAVNSFPVNFDFVFYYTPNQINNMTLGDFDKNGFTDCVFIDGAGAQHCIIAEYRNSFNNFEQLFQLSTTDQGDFSGFANKDFDLDGKIEIVFSTARGMIYVVETIAENQYSLVNQFTFPGYNAYMQTVTNDIDGNGKPEFWIGIQDFLDGKSIFKCYEAESNNEYKTVAYLELQNLASFYTMYLQAIDIDGDEKEEELAISIGTSLLVLKFDGEPNKHHYKVYYAKFGEATVEGPDFFPATIADLNSDGRKDILLPFRKYIEPITYAFSYILVQKSITHIVDELSVTDKKSLEVFPNPFNSTTNIKFNVIERSHVTIKIYDILGKEITTLARGEYKKGDYEIPWNANDNHGNSVTSGVYLILFQSNNSTKTLKTLLIK